MPRSHLQSRTRIYSIWCGIISRCEDESSGKNFAKYGGRGISICRRWRESFVAFQADMGEPPSDRHSIERRNNDGNYEPGNCVWATPAEQARNRRSTLLIEFNGETLCALDWARRYGIKPGTLTFRLRTGWSIHEALTTPVGQDEHDRRPRGESHGRAKLTADQVATIRGSSGSNQDIAVVYGVSKSLIAQIKRGDIWKAAHAADACSKEAA
jgi:hypothetical protein